MVVKEATWMRRSAILNQQGRLRMSACLTCQMMESLDSASNIVQLTKTYLSTDTSANPTQLWLGTADLRSHTPS